MAANLGLNALALTDHDNLNGILEARAAADHAGIELVSGIELSCDWEHGGLHMLGYFLEPGPGELQDQLEELQASRNARNAEIVGRLNELGIDITLEQVEAEAGGSGIGRPHIAQVMVDAGAVESIPQAFDEYLAKGRPAYVDRRRLSPEDAIELAMASRAVTAIAHPHTLGLVTDEFSRTMTHLQEVGLAGLECHYSEYDPHTRAEMVEVAEDHGLVATGGSDYHGSYKEGLELGRGFGDLIVPDEVVEQLGDRIP